jgi:hypothetical protein
MPLEALPFVLKGYTTQAPDLLGPQPEARIVWDKLYLAMKAALRQPGVRLPIDPLWDFLRHGISEK